MAVAPGRNMTDTKIARLLGTSPNTVRNYRKLYNVKRQYTAIVDNALDRHIRKFKRSRPNAGIRYTIGYLRVHDVHVQRRRVIHSLRRVDEIGQVLRDHHRIIRRRYTVLRPNYLWHCDDHHKLIRWGIVIHGFIDGFGRTVRFVDLSIYITRLT